MVKTTGEADLDREVKVGLSKMVRHMHMCLDFSEKVGTEKINIEVITTKGRWKKQPGR